MGKARFHYNNLITTETMVSVSSLRAGLVTSALKEGTGSATLTTSGSFTGSTDLEYIVEIDSIAGGAEVGQATFKWSDGSGAWNATGVTTSATNIALNNGVYIKWTTGTGADFVVGDKWYFKGINLYNAGKMIDLDRDHSYRSAALESPNTITITLDTEAQADALIIFDHNLTSTATIVLWADDAATFDTDGGAAQVIESVTWAADKILHYLTTPDRTKKYWQLRITDAANTDGYIEIGEIYLGTYLELTKNFIEGFSSEQVFLQDSNITPYGIEKSRFYNTQWNFEFDFDFMPPADVTSMKALITAIASRSTGVSKPVWFVDDSAVPADLYLVKINSLSVTHRTRTFYDMPLTFVEVLKSV